MRGSRLPAARGARPEYEKRSSQLWWEVTAGRLLVGTTDGSRMAELDPATGHLLRKIRPAPLANDMWPLDLTPR